MTDTQPPGWEDSEQQLRVDVHEAIDVLLVSIDNLRAIIDLTNAEINANPAAVIKDVAREARTTAHQTVRIARLMVGAFDSTDVGDE